MTQISRPQPEHQNNGYLDSGPYSADQWAELYKVLFTSDEETVQGVLPYVLNSLAVTNPSGSNIQVNTGWGICNGHLLKNDVAVTFTPPNPSANPRIDVVVLVQNNTAVARTAGIASGNNLVFPTSLTDYNGLSSLPPYTCRLAILRGSEAASPTVPTLDVDTATLFMVPLAQYQISTGGTISALTDRRDYAQKVGALQIRDDSVDDTKAGDRVPQFYRRQGGSATNWATAGTTTQTPGAVRMLMGQADFGSINPGVSATVSITFPTAFSNVPLVIGTAMRTAGAGTEPIVVFTGLITASGFTLYAHNAGASLSGIVYVSWLAIGPE